MPRQSSPHEIKTMAAAAPDARVTGRRAAVLVSSLLLAVVAYQLNATMVAPTLPDIAKEFGTATTTVAQVTGLFFLAGSVAGVVATRWSDFIGRRRTLLIVLVIAAAGSLLALVAPSIEVLLLARVLQGVAAGSFQITLVVFGQRLQPKTFALVVAILAAVNGGVAGFDGALGGWLADTFGFRSVFAVILVVALIALISVALVLPRGEALEARGTMDWWGAGLMTAVLITVTRLVATGASTGWLTPQTLAWAVGFAAAVLVFALVERRRKTPLIDTRQLVSRRIWPLLLTTMLFTIAFSAVIYFTFVLFAQDVKVGYGLPAGVAALFYITPAAAVAAVASPFTGWLTARLGWTNTLRIGLALSAAVIAFVALFPTYRWMTLPALALLGITYKGMCIAPVNGLSVLLSPKDAPGMLPGLIGASFGIGSGLGVTTVAATVGAATLGAYTAALWISFSIAVAALAVAFIIPRVTIIDPAAEEAVPVTSNGFVSA